MIHDRIVEQNVPLSKSFIWDLQLKFYQSLGIDAWLSGVVPSRVTTNAFIARTNASMISAYAADTGADELVIIELGAGHGRFGFLCVQQLLEMAEAGTFSVPRWKYVMTDVAERNIVFWQQHEALRPLVDKGVLDFAKYEAGNDTEIRLCESGETINVASRVQQLVLIGNYFFDSLPIDAWQARGGTLSECRPVLAVRPDATCCDKQDAAILEQLTLRWETEVADGPGYAQPERNAVVEELCDRLGDGAFTIPVAAFDTLEVLGSWSENGYLLLTADKGYPREADLKGRPLPTLVQHGCFSFSVNFCALAYWFKQLDGHSWLPEFRDGDLEFTAFCTNPNGNSFDRLNRAYQEGPARFSPGDFHQVVRRCENGDLELRRCLSLIRLSCHEPMVLYQLRRIIRNGIVSACEVDRSALMETLEMVAGRYFHLDKHDIPFAIGLIYQRLGEPVQAMVYYKQSIRLFGAQDITLQNLAECCYACGDIDGARDYANQVLTIDPSDEAAIRLLQLCQKLDQKLTLDQRDPDVTRPVKCTIIESAKGQVDGFQSLTQQTLIVDMNTNMSRLV